MLTDNQLADRINQIRSNGYRLNNVYHHLNDRRFDRVRKWKPTEVIWAIDVTINETAG